MNSGAIPEETGSQQPYWREDEKRRTVVGHEEGNFEALLLVEVLEELDEEALTDRTGVVTA